MSARHVVVTGVTRGLGAALAAELLAAGHAVSGCGRSAPADGAVWAGANARFDAVDLADAAGVAAWAEAVVAERGVPELLVNNAALMNRPAPLWEVPAEEFARLIQVNVAGTANAIRAFVPAMIAAGRGIVVNFSSGWGRSTAPEVAPYCASKWAIEGLTRAMADELPPGLAAVALNPGIVDTDMLRKCWADGASAYEGPAAWARRAAPFLLGLGPGENGKSLDLP